MAIKKIKLSGRKLESLYMAFSGTSAMWRDMEQLVEETYPNEEPARRLAMALALYHAGRLSHQQGYYRRNLPSCTMDHQTEEGRAKHREWCAAPENQAKRKISVEYHMGTFKESSIACWIPALEDLVRYYKEGKSWHDSFLFQRNHKARMNTLARQTARRNRAAGKKLNPTEKWLLRKELAAEGVSWLEEV